MPVTLPDPTTPSASPPRELPEPARAAMRRGGAFGAYLHVPFCSRRCGYCDFNTYTPGELGPQAASTRAFDAGVRREIDLAARVLGTRRPLETVFVGGGTPTLLPAPVLSGLLEALRAQFGFAPGIEITTEANPDTVTVDGLARLARAGVTRVSLGMQSSVPHVLATLDRTHDPAGVAAAVAAARDNGLVVSLDLIYGAPGESPADWRASLEAALALEPDHISAYALVVEEGTRMGALVRRGALPAPDPDDEATKYEIADELLSAGGYEWYEVSNWSRTTAGRCRHNEGYWRDGHWWGFGPGAHSHVGGVRWWNVKHPARYAALLNEGAWPEAGREILDEDQRYDESVLLGVRLAAGLPLEVLRPAGRRAVAGLVADGLVQPGPALGGDGPRRVVLTRTGRLLADLVVRRLLGFG